MAIKKIGASAGYSQRSRIDKLGVQEDMRVALIGIDDPAFVRELKTRTKNIVHGNAAKATEMVVFAVDGPKPLDRLTKLRAAIAPDGAIWVVWPKGQPHIKEDMIRSAALAQGLVDIKVMAFSEALSGLKLVVPRARRAAASKAGTRPVAVKREPKPAPAIPSELKRGLAASPKAKAQFEKFPPSHQREVIGYIVEAKKPETRERRVAQTVEKLEKGWPQW